MEIEKNNFECGLYGTRLCDFVGCDGCDSCVFNNGLDKHSDPETLAANWEVTLSYLPDDIDELHDSETCVFCGKNKRDGYAELSLGHPEPEYKKGMFFGLGKKVRTQVGSLVDLPISCCNSCKRAIRMKDIIEIGGGILVAAIDIGIMLIPAVEKALSNLGWAVPVLIFAAILAVGWVACYLLANRYQKNLAKKIYADPLQIPQVADAVRRGWFPIPEVKRGFARVNFTKKKMRENLRYFPKTDN